MFLDIWKFMQERFPLKVTIPFTAIIFTAPLSLTRFTLTDSVLGWLSTFTILFLLRLVDDISDLKVDRILHPERILISGGIRPSNLTYILVILIFVILILNHSGNCLLFIITLIIFYALFYSLKTRISLGLQPLFVNAVFLGLPLYAGWIAKSRPWSSLFLFGLFIWTAAIAHDFAHSLHDPEDSPSETASLSTLIGPKKVARLALGFFLLAGLLGVFFWYKSGKPLVFIILLACTSFQMIYKSIKLIGHPTRAHAKTFYISGFTFFLIPSMGLIAEQLLKLY